jgi:hypothetical protein
MGGGDKTPMGKGDASRIQSSTAKSGGGGVDTGSFAARAQSSADKNVTKGSCPLRELCPPLGRVRVASRHTRTYRECVKGAHGWNRRMP